MRRWISPTKLGIVLLIVGIVALIAHEKDETPKAYAQPDQVDVVVDDGDLELRLDGVVPIEGKQDQDSEDNRQQQQVEAKNDSEVEDQPSAPNETETTTTQKLTTTTKKKLTTTTKKRIITKPPTTKRTTTTQGAKVESMSPDYNSATGTLALNFQMSCPTREIVEIEVSFFGKNPEKLFTRCSSNLTKHSNVKSRHWPIAITVRYGNKQIYYKIMERP